VPKDQDPGLEDYITGLHQYNKLRSEFMTKFNVLELSHTFEFAE